jgi:NADH-quinone oxidoreductase subunit N
MRIMDVLGLFPEGFLFIAANVLLLVFVFQKRNEVLKALTTVQVIVGIALGLALIIPNSLMVFHQQIEVNELTQLVKVVILSLSFIYLMSIRKAIFLENMAQFEFPLLILFSILGMMLMVSANNFITLFMGLELQSLALYILSGFRRDDMRSSEAAMKYFLLGALSTGIMLYGISFIYGVTGSCNFVTIKMILSQKQPGLTVLTGMIFVIAGLIFKISIVPFHMWTPDVYEGTPTSVTAFLASVPKVAAFVMILRVLYIPFYPLVAQWQEILSFLAIASMTIGAFTALNQHNIKRLLAYSSVGNMGYALIGLVAGTSDGAQASLVYILLYAITILGFFTCLLTLHHRGHTLNNIRDMAGLVKIFPGTSFVMIFLLFSLAGIPPLVGFLGKLYVFQAAIAQGFYALTIIGVITSVIAAAYYLKVVKVITMELPSPDLLHAFTGQRQDSSATVVLVLTTGSLVGLFVKPSAMISLAALAATTLFGR